MISIPLYSFQILIITKYIHFKGSTVKIDKILTPTLSVNINLSVGKILLQPSKSYKLLIIIYCICMYSCLYTMEG